MGQAQRLTQPCPGHTWPACVLENTFLSVVGREDGKESSEILWAFCGATTKDDFGLLNGPPSNAKNVHAFLSQHPKCLIGVPFAMKRHYDHDNCFCLVGLVEGLVLFLLFLSEQSWLSWNLDQVRDPPASASPVLASKAFTTTPD